MKTLKGQSQSLLAQTCTNNVLLSLQKVHPLPAPYPFVSTSPNVASTASAFGKNHKVRSKKVGASDPARAIEEHSQRKGLGSYLRAST